MACSTVLIARDESFSSIVQITEIYIPSNDLWVGEFPYLKRNEFLKVTESIISSSESSPVVKINVPFHEVSLSA